MILHRALYDLAKLVMEVRDGVITSSNAGWMIDSAIANLDANDWYNGGVIWWWAGLLANKTATVTDYTSSSGRFDYATQASAPTGAYSVGTPLYSRQTLVRAINNALMEIGPVDAEYDDAALVVVADQVEYTLPSGVGNVKEVRLAESDATPFLWGEPVQGWRELNGTLYLNEEFDGTAGNRIRLFYGKRYADLSLDADTISEQIHPDRLAKTAAYYICLADYYRNKSDENRKRVELAAQEKMLLANRYPTRRIQRGAILSGY